jgi:hypothetical protein
MLNPDVVGRDKEIERWNGELAFRAVVEATADKAGLEFMRHLRRGGLCTRSRIRSALRSPEGARPLQPRAKPWVWPTPT